MFHRNILPLFLDLSVQSEESLELHMSTYITRKVVTVTHGRR
jgi:hypothetical protein